MLVAVSCERTLWLPVSSELVQLFFKHPVVPNGIQQSHTNVFLLKY